LDSKYVVSVDLKGDIHGINKLGNDFFSSFKEFGNKISVKKKLFEGDMMLILNRSWRSII